MSTNQPLIPDLVHTADCSRTRLAFGRINHELQRREIACPECGRAVPIPWDYEDQRLRAQRAEAREQTRTAAWALRQQQQHDLERRRAEADQHTEER